MNSSTANADIETDATEPPSPKKIRSENTVMEVNSNLPTTLQGLLSRRGITPTYQLMGTEGTSYEPIFTYHVLINNEYITRGTGKSKKEAKSMASVNLLDYLLGKDSSSNIVISEQSLKNDVNNVENEELNNPIGALQELCMGKRWPPPIYNLEDSEGLPHERIFTMSCKVLEHKQIGFGKSKKHAKKNVANKMYLYLLGSELLSDTNEMGRIENSKTVKAERKVKKISELHKNLKGVKGPKITELHNTVIDSGVNYSRLLEELSQELLFEITYVDIEELTKEDKVQCLIQLSTQPVAVCYGSAHSLEGAQTAAIINCLEYLRVMTKP